MIHEKSTRSCTFFGFPASSAYLNPLQQWLYDFDLSFYTEDNCENNKLFELDNWGKLG